MGENNSKAKKKYFSKMLGDFERVEMNIIYQIFISGYLNEIGGEEDF